MTTAWPALNYETWARTKRSLHLYAQMLGKLRLALAPHQPNFLFTSLAVTARGFTTGAMPYGRRSIEASVDVFAGQMSIDASDGRERRIPISTAPSIAYVYGEFLAALRALDVDVTLSPVPQEVADRTPFDRDDRPATFVSADAQRWLATIAATNAVFDAWRAHFFGRAGIQLWWGAFDFALLLFNGKHTGAPADRGYLLKYDLDAEMFNVGFYPGDADNEATFYGYTYPAPTACTTLPDAPPGVVWSDKLGEWVLAYDAVRTAADPEATLAAFLDFIYGICTTSSSWNHADLTYAPPPLRRAPSPKI